MADRPACCARAPRIVFDHVIALQSPGPISENVTVQNESTEGKSQDKGGLRVKKLPTCSATPKVRDETQRGLHSDRFGSSHSTEPEGSA